MQQHRLIGMERWVEPEPALGREVGLHHHVGDQEAVHEDLALDVEAEHAADRAARAVGDDQPVGGERIGSVRRLHTQPRLVVAGRDADDVVPEADFQVGKLAGAADEVFLEVILLQVDHARTMMVRLRAEVEVEDFVLPKEGAPDVPGHTFGDHLLAAAEAVEDLERALGVAHATRPDGYGVVVVEHQHALALLGEVDRSAQANRAGTDDDHGMVPFPPLVDLGWSDIFELRVCVRAQHGGLLLVLVRSGLTSGREFDRIRAPTAGTRSLCCGAWRNLRPSVRHLRPAERPTSAGRARPSRCAGRRCRSPRHGHASHRTAGSARR